MQEQLPRKNRYTGEDVTECNDLGEKVPVSSYPNAILVLFHRFVLIKVRPMPGRG